MKDVLLSGRNVCKAFPGKEMRVLDNINIDLYAGDFTVVMGVSGAGKSTLLYALSGMDGITGGTVQLRGKEMVSGLPEQAMTALRAEKFGFVFQQTHLVSYLSLFENVAVAGHAAKKLNAKEINARAAQLLAQMGVTEAQNRLPAQVSGGEAQRAAIARAVINRPELIFADEPTGALNRANSEEVLALLTDLNRDGQSILMVTHDIRAAIRGNRILYLEDGRILDELPLPSYSEDDLATREKKVTGWLTALQW